MVPDYYKMLGVGVRATGEEIRSAYKKLARQYHPDVNQGSPGHEEKFKQILEAYQTLSDPGKRNRYDMRLLYEALGARNSGGSPDAVYRGTPLTRREKERADYEKRKGDREAYREKTGPPQAAGITLHSLALALMILGSLVMVSLWFGDLMNRHTARKHLEQGDFEGALEFDPELGEAYYARYQARLSRSVPVRFLLDDLNSAIHFSDNPRSGWFADRAGLLLGMDSLDGALADFRTVRRMRPRWDTAYLNLAEFYTRYRPGAVSALLYYDSALVMNRENRLALFGRATLLQELGRMEQSLQAWDHFIRLEPNEKYSRLNRGRVLVELNRFQEACPDFDLALTMGAAEALDLQNLYCRSESLP